MERNREKTGFTLIELALVVLLVGLLASIAAVRFGTASTSAKRRAAEADLHALRAAISGSPSSPGYIADMGSLPGFSPALVRIGNLLCPTNLFGEGDSRLDEAQGDRRGFAPAASFTSWDQEAGRGWRGPYVASIPGVATPDGESQLFPRAGDVRREGDSTFAARGFFPAVAGLSLPARYRESDGATSPYGFAGEPAAGDPWGNPYVLQIPPPQAFGPASDGAGRMRFRYARLVSAGPDGVLATPCYVSPEAEWGEEERRTSRLAGRDKAGAAARGDDLVLFLNRPDLYEEHEATEP